MAKRFYEKEPLVPGYAKDAPKAKLSNLLRCIRAARKAPEVWNRIVAQAGRPYVDPGLVPDDDPDVADLNETRGFISWFAQWCRMKHEPDAHRHGYQGVYDALMAMALTSNDDVLHSALRETLINEHVQDDVSGSED